MIEDLKLASLKKVIEEAEHKVDKLMMMLDLLRVLICPFDHKIKELQVRPDLEDFKMIKCLSQVHRDKELKSILNWMKMMNGLLFLSSIHFYIMKNKNKH